MTALHRGYDADALERQYFSRLTVDNVDGIIAGWQAKSVAALGRLEAAHRLVRDVAYGRAPAEALDLLLPPPDAAHPAPVLVFIHGGYWRSLDKDYYAFALEPLADAGALVASLNYALCPGVTLDEIVREVRAACAWVWDHATDHGGDPSRLHVAGHSAGGHLTATMAATDWPAFRAGLPPTLVKGVVPVSGVFDLEPLRLSSLNADIRLDAAAARRLSPFHSAPATAIPVAVVVGGAETDEFRRQSRALADAWRAGALTIDTVETPGHNHFTVIDAMAEKDSALATLILNQMGL